MHKEIGKVVLDGSESWAYVAEQFSINGTNYKTYTNGGRCYSSHFIGSAIDNVISTNLHMWIGNANFIICKYSDITSTSDFKTWLSTHNTTVYYQLATPTNTEITETTLINQLEAIAKSYNDVTNISQTNNDLPFIIDLQYLMKEGA